MNAQTTLEARNLPLTQITSDADVQPRASLDADAVEEYAADMRLGDTFPAGRVYWDGETYWLSRGFHRYEARKLMPATDMQVEVFEGTKRAAILDAMEDNKAHGLRYTNADKRHKVMKLLQDDEWGGWSDREIARRAGVHNSFVSRLRPLLSPNDSDTERTYTDKHHSLAFFGILSHQLQQGLEPDFSPQKTHFNLLI